MALNLPPHSSNWDKVGDCLLSKGRDLSNVMASHRSVLSIESSVPLSQALRVALTFDTTKPIPVLGSQFIHAIFHSTSDTCLLMLRPTPPYRRLGSSLELITVSSNGLYRLYPISCNTSAPADQLPYTQHTLGSVTEEIGAGRSLLYRSSVTPSENLLKESNEGTPNFHQTDPFSAQRGSEAQSPQMFTPDRSNGKRESIDSGGLTEKPTAWAVIPPHSSSTGIVQILASRSDSIVVIDPMDSTDQRLAAKGPFLRIVPSPNGKFLALLTGPGSGQDFLNDGPPTQMVWCGGDTIVIAWEKSLLMIGPFGASLRCVNTRSMIRFIWSTEIDGIRILSLSTCESLSKVASCTSMVFTPGSTSPAATLFDAMDHFDKHSARVADEHIRNIRKKLTEAVDV
ncbi:hypothetical protein Pst134EA_032434 [Puccinia striiformis f. sp. tritici]|uniref:uncharacterized protein n=1 Tax=Puccinia striiformis f. sp. tritici TaxID=168172 RepID=UPI002008676A|nr:uncharacterized protein Pst134EA_032434 [Puccinia striiformis f. sp. tritici]KAH9444262.1 hypothetical protein Pst134EA_032434 [Puccinia striiformis f. sp. tritici]